MIRKNGFSKKITCLKLKFILKCVCFFLSNKKQQKQTMFYVRATKSFAKKTLGVLSLSVLAFSFSGVSVNTVSTNAQTINTTLNLTGGALTIDTSGSSCTLAATVSNTSQTASCTISGITITDARGTGAGWSSTYTVRNFYSGNNAIPLCPTVECGTNNLSVTMGAYQTVSGDAYGVTDTTSTQSPTALSGMNSTGVNSPAFGLLAFNNASQTYGKANITDAGTGYTSAPTVVFTGGGCTQSPVATATVSGGSLAAINFTTVGLGCTTAPAISFTGGGGAGGGAAATAIDGAGEGQYTKGTATNGFVLTIPARSRAGTYTSVLTVSAS